MKNGQLDEYDELESEVDAGDDMISCGFNDLVVSGDPTASEELTGDEWTGDERTADGLTGDEWSGDERTGDERTGDERSGDERTGDERTGDERSGDERTGDEWTGEDFLGCLVFVGGVSIGEVVPSPAGIFYLIMSSDSKRHCCMCNTCNGKFVNIKTFRLHCKNAHDEHINNLADVQNFSDVDHLYNLQKSQEKDVYQTPLFDGSSRTIFDAIAEHMLIFSTNNGMSKAALTECLQHEKHILPQPNLLPATYKEALNIIKPLLMPIIQYKCCINDCKCFPINDDVRNCSVCNELLHYKDSNRCRKTYNYMPVVPRINRCYGTKNLAKLIHADKVKINGQLSDYTDGKIFIDQMKHGIFKDSDVSSCVPLALFTDGVNPNKNTVALKSMWPIILTWITLPQDIRYVLGPMMF
ncbi:uncharacterized protein [Mytilus edulis]|uniref:uncharacterized protein n=1 Tax=Mytilus edulis TaxID=6550 RepID=UPI0039F02C72